ncbi:MAG: hypothetical protein IKF72_04415, partial [Kiritimatiellae bacterium]|nr:hypothetical protein [Kiritimatiellia bacterium]
AAVSFGVGLTSANTVGYAGNDLDDEGGAAAVAPQFTTVGSQEGIKLKDITPITDTGTSLRRKVQIQLLTSEGLTAATYRWEGQGGKTWIAAKTTDDVGETVIPAGLGLWVLNTANCATTFQTLGEVSMNDIIQPLDDEGGAALIGNSFPVAVKLKDIVPSTETGTSLRRKVQIQLLTPEGLTAATYRWEGQGGKTWIAAKTTDDVGETEIPAGQAMWVLNTANCAATLRIPAPEL